MDMSHNLSDEKPRNGIAGLKHWRHDIVAGLLVSLISVPFSLGIAVASGAPPIAGLMSAIIAGMVLPFLGGSYVTISGPAAGLAPALLAAMMILGRGNLTVGYPLLLVAICLTGIVQIVLASFKMARFCAIFPSTVVEGMLASIGLLIIAKQLPHLVGHPFEAHEFFGILAETPSQLAAMNVKVFGLGVFCLVLVFALGALKYRWLKAVPPQVIVVVVGIVLGLILQLDSKYLIQIPAEPFKHGFVPPNFRGVFADHTLWLAVFTTVLTLTLIDGVESLATMTAIDKIDPFHRKSNPNRTLFAMGVSNICSSAAGGLTIIPGGVKSTACIQGGGRTQWANFYNATFLLIFLLFGRSVINLIPLSSLAAILIFTGYKLCKPAVWRHIAHIGKEQLLLFTLTVFVTLSTDLLWGIIFGIVAKLAMNVGFTTIAARRLAREQGPNVARTPFVRRFTDLFRNPVTRRELVGDAYHLYFDKPLVCFNTLHANHELHNLPADAKSVVIHIDESVHLIDHTSCENVMHFREEFERNGRGQVEILGIELMRAGSEYPSSMRLRPPSSLVLNGSGAVKNGTNGYHAESNGNGNGNGHHAESNGNGNGHHNASHGNGNGRASLEPSLVPVGEESLGDVQQVD